MGINIEDPHPALVGDIPKVVAVCRFMAATKHDRDGAIAQNLAHDCAKLFLALLEVGRRTQIAQVQDRQLHQVYFALGIVGA